MINTKPYEEHVILSGLILAGFLFSSGLLPASVIASDVIQIMQELLELLLFIFVIFYPLLAASTAGSLRYYMIRDLSIVNGVVLWLLIVVIIVVTVMFEVLMYLVTMWALMNLVLGIKNGTRSELKELENRGKKLADKAKSK